MVMFSFVISIGLTFITRASEYARRMRDLSRRLSLVRAFMAHHNLPHHMRDALLDFYYNRWVLRREQAGLPCLFDATAPC
jgi:hypothetical protein